MALIQFRRLGQAAGREDEPATHERRRTSPRLLLQQFAYRGHDPVQEEPVFRAVVRNEGAVDAARARLEIWRRLDRDSKCTSRPQVIPSGNHARFEVVVPQDWTHDGGTLRRGTRARIIDEATGAACEVWPR